MQKMKSRDNNLLCIIIQLLFNISTQKRIETNQVFVIFVVLTQVNESLNHSKGFN